MSGVVVVLCGIPGVGKGTVGRLLAERLGATFVENHAVNELVFRVTGVRPGGVVPKRAFVWTARMQEYVREMVEEISPPGASFVFSHTAYDLPAAYDAMDDYRRMADAVGARFLTVTLHCGREELARRISTEDRRIRLKLTDVDVAWGPDGEVFIPFRGALATLDTTGFRPESVAVAIERALEGPLPGERPETPDDDPEAPCPRP